MLNASVLTAPEPRTAATARETREPRRRHASCGGSPLCANQTTSNEGHAPCLSCHLSLEILRDLCLRSQPHPTPHVPLLWHERRGEGARPKNAKAQTQWY